VRTFGGLSIEVDERQLEIGKKIPKQPLNLLKLLAVHRTQTLSSEEIGLALWPDIPAANHPSTLKTTLSRLRKLVGRDSIVQQEGRLRLNSESVWTDSASVEILMHQQVDGLDAAQLKSLWRRLKSVYRGMLLPEDDHYWVLAARERMHVGFTRLVNRIVDRALALDEHDMALDVCLYGLDVDPLAEGFYRGLMQAHVALGQHGEAVRVYRRCQQILNSRLAIEPAPETKAIYTLLADR
jgi:DNA-binding SARP family transcriptional activator